MAMMAEQSVIFLFLDGVGMGPADDANPFWVADTPTLHHLLGGALVDGVQVNGKGRDLPIWCRGIDATLGVPGLPQSGTGQTALFTGVNAAEVAGTHVFAFPTERLRAVIAENSLLKRATEHGMRATLANAYSDGYWSWVQEKRRGRHSATTLVNMAAGLPFRTFADLEAGRAVYWDITHEVARKSFYPDLQPIPAVEAGRRLARLGREYHLVLYETFITDLAGHGRLPLPTDWILRRVDGLLEGVIAERPAGATIVLCSDHGNIEDSQFKGHTTNPVPLLVIGPAAKASIWDTVNDITDVPGAIMAWLNGSSTT